MVTTVTNNSPQAINTSLFSLEKEIEALKQNIERIKASLGDLDTGVVSVNGKAGVVTLNAADVGALPDTTHIPTDPVQSNWTETNTNSLAYIKNKPSLATVATSGSYNDLSDKPSIPAAQVNSDWNATSGVAEILNKPTIPTATSQLTNDSDFATNSALNSVTAIGLKETYHFTRTNIAPQTWTDIITLSDIPRSGIYVFNLYFWDNTYWWSENATFLTYFFAMGTNSKDSTPIYFNQEGHAPNGQTIQLRFQRVMGNTYQQSIQIYFSNCNQSTINLKVSAYRVA